MADTRSVTVPTPMFNVAAFPAICAKTGVPTQEKRSMKAERVSPLVAVGLIFGLIGVAVMFMITRKTSAGAVPFASNPQQIKKRRTIGSIVTGLGVLATGGFFTGVDALMFVGLLGLLAAVCGLMMLGMANNPGIQLELSKDQQFVSMKKVHPAFAEATLAMMSTVAGGPSATYQPMPNQAPPHPPMPYQTPVPVGPPSAAPAPVPAPAQFAPAAPTVMPPASPSDPFRN